MLFVFSQTVAKKHFSIKDYETPLDVSTYYIQNGLRKVYPYHYTFYAFCKERWVGRKPSELFSEEFNTLTTEKVVCFAIGFLLTFETDILFFRVISSRVVR